MKTQRFNLSPDVAWPDARRFMWKKKYNIFHLLHDHPVSFGSYVSLGSRNISFFICHLTTCIHVIKGSYDFLCSSTLSKPIILSYLLAASLLEVEIHCFLFVLWLHVTASSKDHAELYVAPSLVKFGGRGNRGYGNILLFIYHMTSCDHIIKELLNFFWSKTLFIFYRLFRSRDIYPSCDILCSSPLSLVQSCHVWWLLERKIYWFLFVTWPHSTAWPINHATFM